VRLTDYFDNFLAETVNLSQFNLDTLEDRVDAIYAALKADPELGPRVVKKTPQGSWAQRTIISPQPGRSFDADLMLQLQEEPEWADDVRQYSNAVYRAIHNHATYGKMPHGRKCRCVFIEYAENKMHVDAVPTVILADGQQVIINRDENEFEATNPTGLTEWMKNKDATTNGNLRKVIRLVKYLRDHKNSFTGTKSVLLTTLLGGQVEEWRKVLDSDYYADVPTALVHIVSDLDEWMQARPTKPSVPDPSGTELTFDHRWTPETYSYFRDRIHAHAAAMREAYDETDKDTSVERWQALFGENFKGPKTSTSGSKFAPGAAGAGTAGEGTSAGRSGRAG